MRSPGDVYTCFLVILLDQALGLGEAKVKAASDEFGRRLDPTAVSGGMQSVHPADSIFFPTNNGESLWRRSILDYACVEVAVLVHKVRTHFYAQAFTWTRRARHGLPVHPATEPLRPGARQRSEEKPASRGPFVREERRRVGVRGCRHTGENGCVSCDKC